MIILEKSTRHKCVNDKKVQTGNSRVRGGGGGGGLNRFYRPPTSLSFSAEVHNMFGPRGVKESSRTNK